MSVIWVNILFPVVSCSLFQFRMEIELDVWVFMTTHLPKVKKPVKCLEWKTFLKRLSRKWMCQIFETKSLPGSTETDSMTVLTIFHTAPARVLKYED